jgi:hypothetical protein
LFTLKCHNEKELKPKFYIQSKGEHSGRPLKKPIPNCFSVYTNFENLESLILAIYLSGKFKKIIIGSVVPFIRITETKKIIQEHLIFENNTDLFTKIKDIETLKTNLKEQLILIGQLQSVLCFKSLQA